MLELILEIYAMETGKYLFVFLRITLIFRITEHKRSDYWHFYKETLKGNKYLIHIFSVAL